MHREGESYIHFQGCMWHHCLFLLDLRGGDEISSIQRYTQRAKPFTCPSSNCVLSRAHRCAQLCSSPGHKGLPLYIACKTILFLMHNYFQGPLSSTVEDGSGRHADPKGPSRLSYLTGQGREFLLVILMPGLIPPPAVPCLFGTQHPAPSQLSFTPAEYFITPELRSDPCMMQVAREQRWDSGFTAVRLHGAGG